MLKNNTKAPNFILPSTSIISSYIKTSMNIKNPYSSNTSGISSNPCTLGTVSITMPSKGNYSVNIYSPKTQKISPFRHLVRPKGVKDNHIT